MSETAEAHTNIYSAMVEIVYTPQLPPPQKKKKSKM